MKLTETEKERFAKDNFGLVHSCAGRFCGRGIEYDDLFSAGCVGLVKAIEGFDESRGFKFSTYAVPVILGEIKRLFRDGGAVKVSRGIKELSLKISKASAEFIKQNGREPTVNELASALGASAEDVAQAISAALPPVSLTPADDESAPQIDIGTDSSDDRVTDAIVLQSAVEKLAPDERKIILMRYFRHRTQSETAKEMNMTQVQVSRREKKILMKLRVMLM